MASDPRTMPEVLDRAVGLWGDLPAVVDGSIHLTYRQVDERARQAAAAFIANDVQPGDAVAIMASNSWQWIIATLGATCVGAYVVPINTRYKGQETAYVLDRTKARVMVTETDFLGLNFPKMLRESGTELPNLTTVITVSGPVSPDQVSWDDFIAAGQDIEDRTVSARRDAVSGENISDVMFTSGTTGLPKGVVTTHAKTLWTYTRLAKRLGFTVGDRDLLPLPFFHGFGYKAGWLACFLHGAAAYPMAVYDIDEIVRTVEREKITILLGPPTMYHSLLALPDLANRDLGSLRVGLAGAASVPVELVSEIMERLSFDVVLTGYGLTESNGNAATTSAGDPPEVIARSVGRALDGVEIEVRDMVSGRAIVGTAGEIVIRGYNVMVGYLDDDDATRAVIDADGWLHTGDIGIIDNDGILQITDRLKDMFISGGINAYPAEIERAMHSHPDLEQIAIVGVPDSRLGEVGMAFVVPRPGRLTTEGDIISWCRDRMANYKIPRYVEILDALPLNPTGKVVKNELRATASDRLAARQQHILAAEKLSVSLDQL